MLRTDGAQVTCVNGHPYPESKRPGRSDCAVCHREGEMRRARNRGILARVKITTCKRGHDLTDPDNVRPGRKGCAECHRWLERTRYAADPELARTIARAYAQAHRQEAAERLRIWRQKNPERDREIGRDSMRRRSLGRNPEAVFYAGIIRCDPCSYCGGEGGTIDHIEPVVHGGDNLWENLTSACSRCNSAKKDRPLLSFMRRH